MSEESEQVSSGPEGNGAGIDPTAVALVQAHRGNFSAAEKLLDPLLPDRDMGLRARVLVAEWQGQHARADWWFARSELQTPSIPLTDQWWGQALLARGQPNGAIEKFARASKLGLHFADPLEGWGEALVYAGKKGQAKAQFTRAAQLDLMASEKAELARHP